MKLLKALVIINLVLASTLAYSAEQKPVKYLVCEGELAFINFLVTLDSSSFAIDSEFIVPKHARLTASFWHSRDMSCEGHKAEELHCVGYFNSPSHIVEVVTSLDEKNQIQAKFETLRGDKEQSEILTCKIEE